MLLTYFTGIRDHLYIEEQTDNNKIIKLTKETNKTKFFTKRGGNYKENDPNLPYKPLPQHSLEKPLLSYYR